MKRLCLLAVVFSALAGQKADAAVDLTVGSGVGIVSAANNVGDFAAAVTSADFASFSFSETIEAPVDSANSTATFSASSLANAVQFDIQAVTQNIAAGGSFASAQLILDITLNEPVNYVFSAQYAGTADDSGNLFLLEGFIFDGSPFLYHESDTGAASAVDFALNQVQDGNQGGSVTGSRTGTLGPGTYLFSLWFQLQDDLDLTGAQSASGSAQILFTQATATAPAPEPASVALWGGLGALGLLGARRRRPTA